VQLSDPGASALLRTDICQASPSGARRFARLTNSPSPDRENADWLTLGGANRRSSSGARHPKRDRPAVCSFGCGCLDLFCSVTSCIVLFGEIADRIPSRPLPSHAVLPSWGSKRVAKRTRSVLCAALLTLCHYISAPSGNSGTPRPFSGPDVLFGWKQLCALQSGPAKRLKSSWRALATSQAPRRPSQ
jgi:hypothetical protein